MTANRSCWPCWGTSLAPLARSLAGLVECSVRHCARRQMILKSLTLFNAMHKRGVLLPHCMNVYLSLTVCLSVCMYVCEPQHNFVIGSFVQCDKWTVEVGSWRIVFTTLALGCATALWRLSFFMLFAAYWWVYLCAFVRFHLSHYLDWQPPHRTAEYYVGTVNFFLFIEYSQFYCHTGAAGWVAARLISWVRMRGSKCQWLLCERHHYWSPLVVGRCEQFTGVYNTDLCVQQTVALLAIKVCCCF